MIHDTKTTLGASGIFHGVLLDVLQYTKCAVICRLANDQMLGSPTLSWNNSAITKAVILLCTLDDVSLKQYFRSEWTAEYYIFHSR